MRIGDRVLGAPMEDAMSVSTTDLGPRPTPRSGSVTTLIVSKLIAICAIIPYALIAFGLRFVMARVFFLSGQTMIDGPTIPFGVGSFSFPVTLPAAVKDATFQMFQTQFAALPIPPTVAAYLFSYAGFLLPICLIAGFATRFTALLLLIITVMISIYVMPDAFWTMHVYWIAILTVLMSIGPGALSVDAIIRYVYEQ
jgi:putative oxidoreductase